MKILQAIVITGCIGFIGFILTVLTSLFTASTFYLWLIPIVTLFFIMTVNLPIFEVWQKRTAKKANLFILIISMSIVIGHILFVKYDRSLEVVSSQDTDLTEYIPYSEGTKVVQLNEESTLKIEGNLPKLDGSTALYPVYAGFAQAVYPEKDYSIEESEVVSSQTGEAFERLLNKEADIIFIPKPSEQQYKLAESHGVQLKLTPIGREAFIFFVHAKNPIETLSVEQIQDIYSGKITNWKEVGGNRKKIRAFQRPAESGSQTALIRVMGGKPLMDPPTKDVVSAMEGIINETADYQNKSDAIGFSFRHFSEEMVRNGKIKNISVEGIPPTIETIKDGSYPFINEFYAITLEDNDSPQVDRFLKWMLSEQGQRIVSETGYVAVE
ncbi:substrate-binding domain-containing protein [Cytobacillus oceanisediminis]|uniref:PstS family phosphate ABC transporter substrate-binding protein n=1 Tax=Cytobacillus oceanisediminis TaxID=665099 RepID=UPI001CCDD428|nr:substrate-binding domain-containing protein [Cytobacillus oceanisediminis]MBZ9535416.1 substrate-binding domain-containing protein [Cytobacillus oceanisediminis]